MTDKVTAIATKIDWSGLTGVILEGGYELKDVAEVRDDAAKVRVRILGSGGKTGLAYFLYLEAADAEDQLDIWHTLREAPHANVNRPAAVGKHVVGGVETIYLVLADADENLAAVVPERSLEWEEAAEVLHSCEKGLAHLHAHGLMHGSVSPQTVEAVGYSVQLNTASVRRIGKNARVEWDKPQYLAPESKGTNLTTAADVWCLGATLFEVLAQHPYGTPGVELEKGLPLAAVIQRCVDKNPVTRCTLKEAPTLEQTAAQAEAAKTASANGAAAEANQAQTAASSTAKPAGPPPYMRSPDERIPGQSAGSSRNTTANRIPQPLTPKAPARQVTKEDMALVPVGKRHRRVQRQPVGARIRTLDESEMEPTTGETSPAWSGPAVSARILALGHKSTLARNIIAGVGCFLLFVAAIWFIIIPKLQSTEQPAMDTVSAQTAADATPNRPPLPASVTASPTAPSEPAQQDDTPPVPVPVRRDLYRVVISSFTSRTQAAREMDTLAEQHPELILRIAPMRGDAGEATYVVAVGGILNIGEAEPLKERLVSKGLKSAHLQRVGK